MKDRKKMRKVIANKVTNRLQQLRVMLNVKMLLEERDIPSKGKPFEFIADHVLKTPFGLEEC
jgi:hypothetical protein